MSDKRYATIRIKDPTAASHLVRVHPNQKLELHLTGGFSNVMLEGGHLLLADIPQGPDVPVSSFEIQQAEDFSEWAKLCSAYLGTVVITPDSQKGTVRRIPVILDSENRDIITVVNPAEPAITIEQGQIIELVVPKQPWRFGVVAGTEVLNLQLIWTQVLQKNLDYAKHPDELLRKYALFRNTEAGIEEETHFWFGLDEVSKRWLHVFDEGTYYAGKITLYSGDAESPKDISVKVYMRIKNKKKGKQPLLPVQEVKFVEPGLCVRSVALKEKDVDELDSECRVIIM